MNKFIFYGHKAASKIACLAVIALLTGTGCMISSSTTKSAPADRELQAYTSNLPFKMPELQLTSFPNKNFSILNYGGVGDGITENTDALTKAITDCSASGGGSVIVPSGVWLTGPITLRSNINLHLEKGALILFSPNRDEYKKGANNSSLITGSGLHNVAVTGDGLINGSGEAWRPVKKDKMTATQWKNLLSSGGVVSDDGTIWAPKKN